MTREEAIRYIEDRAWMLGNDCLKNAKEAISVLSKPVWFSAKEKQPEKDGEYLVTARNRVAISRYENGHWAKYKRVDAWMPLPDKAVGGATW